MFFSLATWVSHMKFATSHGTVAPISSPSLFAPTHPSFEEIGMNPSFEWIIDIYRPTYLPGKVRGYVYSVRIHISWP